MRKPLLEAFPVWLTSIPFYYRMPKKLKNFKNKEAYDKYVAHIHIAGIPHHTGVPVDIAGKKHVPKVSKYEKGACPGGYCSKHKVVHY